MALENMKNHFSGLPMDSLIGGPLKAACESQIMLAKSTTNFIQEVGFENGKTRTADFSYTKSVAVDKDSDGNTIYGDEKVDLHVPVLSIVNIPSLSVQEVEIDFSMEVKSSEQSSDSSDMSASMSAKGGGSVMGFDVGVSMSGSVATHKSNTRKSDNSAKYNVRVHALDNGTPEGLSRVLDILSSTISPTTPITAENNYKNNKLSTEEKKQIQIKQTDLSHNQKLLRAKEMDLITLNQKLSKIESLLQHTGK